MDIGSSWFNNYNSGNDTWVTDSIVDTGYSLLKYGVGYDVFSACMLIPGIGLCIAIEIGLDNWMADKMDDIKHWASDVGRNVEKGWNQFWSFSWI